jgi:hypothetical protein
MVKTRAILGLCGLLLWVGSAYADEPHGRFDGVWHTVIACAPSKGALPYSYQFYSTVREGVLHGERGVKHAPGWLRLDGSIRPDGSADITARGLVGKPRAALGYRPSGTPYTYRIEAKFSANSGAGHRTSKRTCTVSFSRH